MNDDSSLDAFGRHLARLLTTADLSTRLVRREATPVATDLLALLRELVSGSRASLFRVEGLDGDSDDNLSVVRIARVTREGFSDAAVDYDPRACSLLLSCLWSGASEAIGPLSPTEPFRAAHVVIEPEASPHALFVPVSHASSVFGVLEIARASAPFSPEELAWAERAARIAVPAVFLSEREETVADLLLSLLDPAVGATPLRGRVRAFLEARRSTPDERRAWVVAASIAELGQQSSKALVLAEEVLEAVHRALATEGK